MADSTSVLDRYPSLKMGEPTADVQRKLKEMNIDWQKYNDTKNDAHSLGRLKLDGSTNAAQAKQFLDSDPRVVQAIVNACKISSEPEPAQYVLTFLYEMIREDSSLYSVLDKAVSSNPDILKPVSDLLDTKNNQNPYTADKAAWLITTVVANQQTAFSQDKVRHILSAVLSSCCSELGSVEAIANLLKADQFRAIVWSDNDAANRVMRVTYNAPAPVLYKSVFAIWMISFDDQLMSGLGKYEVAKKIKEILIHSRSEKVIRLCLTVLRNFLGNTARTEELVEEGTLEAVNQLEFEKWRDQELYDDIRDVSQKISEKVNELSNYARYEREVSSGSLQWGFIHSSKFWSENINEFEKKDFKCINMLAACLNSFDPTTLAVACHDIGEFVALHPMGKKKMAQLNVKDRIMQLMGTADPKMREVRREALLCCQKLMLNKWQDMDKMK